ncbi:MAG: CvpA family protein [Gemmataceae bacterium]
MLAFLTVAIMGITGFVYFREGLLTAFAMFCNVFLSGLLAFCFWEPLADVLDPLLAKNALHGYEDFLALFLLFSVPLLIFRWLTNVLAPHAVEFYTGLQEGGGAFFGLAMGYLLSGFLVCMLQTLPWHQEFMGFNAEYSPSQTGAALRRVLPPDRVWLGLMNRASLVIFSTAGKGFDNHGSFELRYSRYRRYNDKGEVALFLGETSPAKE